MARSDRSLAIIDHLHAGLLLGDPLFLEKLRSIAGQDFASLYFGQTGGFWSEASRRFAASTSADILAIAPNPASFDPARPFHDGLFASVEVQTLLVEQFRPDQRHRSVKSPVTQSRKRRWSCGAQESHRNSLSQVNIRYLEWRRGSFVGEWWSD